MEEDERVSDGVREAFGATAQDAVNKLAETHGVIFELPDHLANDPDLVGAISALAIAAALYGDLSVNNSLVQDALFGVDRNDGRTATGIDAELSLAEMTDALAQLIMSYAQSDNTDTILDGIDGSNYQHCELDFGG